MLTSFVLTMFLISIPFQVEKPILVMNATAILNSCERVENSAIAFHEGQFTMVANATMIKLDLKKYEVIDAYGKYVYPLAMVNNKCQFGENKFNKTKVDSIKEGGEASFAIVSLPLDSICSIEMIFIKGNRSEK